MPSTEETIPQTPETPPERVMRQFYQAKLGEQLGQFAEMAAGRDMLRRGAKKQQDGTLGKDTGEPEADDMNIRVGDEVHQHYHSPPAAPQPQPTPRTPQPSAADPVETPAWKIWAKRAAMAALPIVGAGAVWGWQAFTGGDDKPPPQSPSVVAQPAPDRVGGLDIVTEKLEGWD